MQYCRAQADGTAAPVTAESPTTLTSEHFSGFQSSNWQEGECPTPSDCGKTIEIQNKFTQDGLAVSKKKTWIAGQDNITDNL